METRNYRGLSPDKEEAINNYRQIQRQYFLQQTDWRNAASELLPADASFRRYHRLTLGMSSCLLMDAPQPHENIRSFIAIACHLCELGFSAPRILAVDESLGFALIEDFGYDTYTRLLNAGANDYMLYELAVDTLCALHQHPRTKAIALPAYNITALLQEVALLPDWYLPLHTGTMVTAVARETFIALWRDVFKQLPLPDNTLVLRDFHVDNLMLLPEKQGVAQCGLLDFQDARIGSTAYDLVSLLEDARRDLDAELVTTMKNRYLSTVPTGEQEAFKLWYTVLSAQRHCKVIGIFVRLYQRDGKAHYLAHIPRVLHLLEASLSLPLLQPLKNWLDDHVPDRLQRFPSECS